MTAKIEVAPAAAAIGGPRLRRAESLPAAIREFSGLQLRDYGGAGGLKTINVRSLGSAHTAIFLDGAPIDNAQNAQVDLGRISTEGLEKVELFQGQRSRLLQTAREYGSASALHLTSALPSPDGKHGFRVRLRGGAFGTVSRVARSAVDELREEGYKVGLFRPITVWPFPYDELKKAVNQPQVKAVLDIEVNEGQMLEDVNLAVSGARPVEFLGHCGSLFPTTEEVKARILAMLKEGK